MTALTVDQKLIVTACYVVAVLLVRWVVVYRLKKLPDDDNDSPRRWVSSVRNTANLLLVCGVVLIWLSELRYMALSIAAFAVALVVATRDLIQCFLGSLYQTSTRAFSVGDWIRVGSHCGKVVNSDWLSTSLLEIDIDALSYEFTGRTVVVPNSLLIGSSVTNLNFMRHYVRHSFSIVRDAEPVNVFELRDAILERAGAHCEPFQEIAIRYSGLLEKRLGIKGLDPEPSVRISSNSVAKDVFTVMIFCPTREAQRLEQLITGDFMALWHAARERSAAR